MFKRRSSKDLSAKIGYDHITAKPAKKIAELAVPASNNVAPVGNIVFAASGVPTLQSSSSRRASGTSAGGGTPPTVPTTATGASPMTSMVKSLPASTNDSPKEVVAVAVVSKAPPNSAAPSKPSSKSSASAPAKVPQEPPSKSLVIGEGVLFEGTTEGCAAAIVGGKLRGTVKTRRLEITKAGRMEGSAFAETAEIAGVFEGTLDVTKSLKICSTGRFKGDVSFGSIVVENGGKLEGKVNYGGCRSPMPESSADAKKPVPADDDDASSEAPVEAATTEAVVEATEEAPAAAVEEVVEPSPEVEKVPEVAVEVVESPAQSPE